MFNLDSCMFISDLKPSDCASWVQAVGTIVAILVSAGLVYLQFYLTARRSMHVKHLEHKVRLETVFQLCSYSRQVAEKVIIEAKRQPNIDESFLQASLGELDSILTALKKYEPSDFGDYEQLQPFMVALAMTTTARSACESARLICATRAVSGQIAVTMSGLVISLKEAEGNLKNLANKHSETL